MARKAAGLRRSSPPVALALAAIIIGIVAGLWAGNQALPAYLAAYLFWLGLPVGSLAVLMVHHLTGGEWGNAVRQPLLQATRLLPLLALLILPLLLFPQHLYPWVHTAGNESAAHSTWYLNRPFFTGRAIVYLLLWLALAWVLNNWARPQSPRHNEAWARRFSAGGLVVLLITVSLAAFD
jgi:hypothetical protein